MKKYFDKLGKPRLQIQGLKIWIHHRQFPNLTDYWDGNWLVSTAYCSKDNSEVWIIAEPFIFIPELEELKDKLEILRATYQGKIELEPIEPYLRLEIVAQSENNMKMKIDITSNSIENYKEYQFNIDKNDLGILITDLKDVLREYPIRGKP